MRHGLIVAVCCWLWLLPATATGQPTDTTKPLRVGLYISFGTLQALDVHSTLLAVNRGARELNPLVASLAYDGAGLTIVKAGTTAATIYATERLAKTHPRLAVVIMTGLVVGSAAVVAHNYSVARQLGP